ncbi:MAG: hypothetical protein WC858_01870 [Parcubacteria group bacterium]|jgi:glycerol uptake facilitator-like aquaporin
MLKNILKRAGQNIQLFTYQLFTEHAFKWGFGFILYSAILAFTEVSSSSSTANPEITIVLIVFFLFIFGIFSMVIGAVRDVSGMTYWSFLKEIRPEIELKVEPPTITPADREAAFLTLSPFLFLWILCGMFVGVILHFIFIPTQASWTRALIIYVALVDLSILAIWAGTQQLMRWVKNLPEDG